nr:nucleoprotein [Callicarpa mosaic-associated virus 2]
MATPQSIKIETIGKNNETVSRTVRKTDILDCTNIRFNSETSTDNYSLMAHLNSKPDVTQCVQVCSATKELKMRMKESSIIKYNLKLDGVATEFILVHSLKQNKDAHIMSINRFISICSGAIFVKINNERFDWDTKKYVKTKTPMIGSVPEDSINRLAESIGISRDSRLYWIYLPGVENLFDLCPYEVIAICSWRALNPEKSKMTGDSVEMLKSLSNKFAKRNVTLEDFQEGMLIDYYNELNSCTHTSMSLVKARELFNKLGNLYRKNHTSGL